MQTANRRVRSEIVCYIYAVTVVDVLCIASLMACETSIELGPASLAL